MLQITTSNLHGLSTDITAAVVTSIDAEDHCCFLDS